MHMAHPSHFKTQAFVEAGMALLCSTDERTWGNDGSAPSIRTYQSFSVYMLIPNASLECFALTC